jgi:isopentenyl diphosphate isomerase/L-lactate dehydrogenase-like FMN-dependent dehydrogenase
MGQRLATPFYCSATALQRLFHHDGERAVAAAASKFGTMFGISSLGTVAVEELRKAYETPRFLSQQSSAREAMIEGHCCDSLLEPSEGDHAARAADGLLPDRVLPSQPEYQCH